MYSRTDFLLKHIFLAGLSSSLHVVCLLVLIILYLCKKFKCRVGDHASSGAKVDKNKMLLCYKCTLFCCFLVLAFNFVWCILSYSCWYRFESSDGGLITLSDLVLKAVSWGGLYVYLNTQFLISAQTSFPFLLRIWWALYFLISCYCLVVDIVLYQQNRSSLVQYSVSDAVSVFSGLFLCIVGSWKVRNEGILLTEPLLNDNAFSNIEASKPRKGDSTTPYSNATSIFSLLTFSWVGPLIKDGNNKALDLEDVPQLYSRDSVIEAFPVFREKLAPDPDSASRVSVFKLTKALLLSVWKEILWTGLLELLCILASYVGPYLMDAFVKCISGEGEFRNQGYLLGSAFLVAELVESVSSRRSRFILKQIGMKMHSVVAVMIYDKGLTLSCQSKQCRTSGEMINFMSVDAARIGDSSVSIHDPWGITLEVGLALLILYKNLGLASVAALLATVIVMLLNYPLGRWDENLQDKLMEAKDERMKATSEILKNMRILKLQAWEMKFLSRIVDLRKAEEGWLKKYVYVSAVFSFFFFAAPIFVSAVTFGACLLLGIPLESGKVLSALATFRMLQEPIMFLPMTISEIIQTKVSLCRVASFLCLDELQTDVVEELPVGTSDVAVEIADGNFSWDLSAPNPTLKDINLKVFHGMKVAVCGTVGCGKSSLLSFILGETTKISGSVKLCGTKAYVAQLPWIQSGKIEENILFCNKMDRQKYERILQACSLKKDLEILPFGDQTIIGERGINLSGGQKQRIQIARALYQDADIYLFDDPFSAVDAHTGSHLFKEVLLGALSSKTVVYVTHQVEFLSAADLILVMKDGRITQAGKYNDILNTECDFGGLVSAHKTALSALDSKKQRSIAGKEHDGLSSDNGVALSEEKDENLQNGVPSNEIAEASGQLVQEESREKGRVGFPVYWKYITIAYRGVPVPFILLTHILVQILQIGSNYWMAWATPMSKQVKPAVSGQTLITVYAALSFGSSFCNLLRAALYETTGYKAATLLFNKMHLCIFRAPMSFFDATPSGRILNRASTDQSEVDVVVACQLWAVAFSMINLVGSIAVMSQVAWQVFVLFVPVIAVSIWYQQYYIPSARELSRLAGTCKAPVIQHFSETLSGATTIRSFDKISRFRELNMKLMDTYTRLNFYSAGALGWLGFRLDMLSAFMFAFCLFFLISFPYGIDPAIAGLAMMYGLRLNNLQGNLIWNICDLEYKMISVERILQYMSISSEPPLVMSENRPASNWPSLGKVDIANLQVRYAPHLPLVLRGLTCTIPGGSKFGIIGRTGSGKSTLIQTLFRIVEPTVGQIAIDGINISAIGVHDLRSKLSIIPQDPTMFDGTVRSNLDPLESYTDKEIWEALDNCQLGNEVRNKEKRLDSKVIENGENWSMGQRQLICLGRVLLKRNKILVLDEATASVDTATDNLIQKTIRQHFSECTVITIAHRITSVLDSDKVLLLNNGLIEEYDSPGRLLANKSSSFAKLVAEYTQSSTTR